MRLLSASLTILVVSSLLSVAAAAQDDGGVPATTQAPAEEDSAEKRKTLREAREERRRKIVAASYCLPLLRKLQKQGSDISTLNTDNCAVAGFSGGDFMKQRDAMKQVKGVIDVQLGYMGGWKKNPTYKEVCSGSTGHSEMVVVAYNRDEADVYDNMLDAFFKAHDPRSRTQMGDYSGTQWKSQVFLLDKSQLDAFAAKKKKLDNIPEYKEEKQWILTRPTALRESPNNFFAENQDDATLEEIRTTVAVKISSKVNKLNETGAFAKLEAQAEKDIAMLKKAEKNKPIIVIEKDSGVEQQETYKKADAKGKIQIEGIRKAALDSVLVRKAAVKKDNNPKEVTTEPKKSADSSGEATIEKKDKPALVKSEAKNADEAKEGTSEEKKGASVQAPDSDDRKTEKTPSDKNNTVDGDVKDEPKKKAIESEDIKEKKEAVPEDK